MELMNLGGEYPCESKSVSSQCRRNSIKENLEAQQKDLQARLTRVNNALDALNSNPEVLKILELISIV